MRDAEDVIDLMACPQCDALYRPSEVSKGARAVCARCHHVLAAPRKGAGLQIVALSIAVVILVFGAAFFPFLRIEVAGLANSASLIEAITVFAGGQLEILAVLTGAVILLIPVTRAVLLVYVIGPLVFDKPPARRARRAFALSERLRPWSMAEVFAIGCAVSLIKISDLAHVDFGPAFWMFAILVVLIVAQERVICSWSVWNALSRR